MNLDDTQKKQVSAWIAEGLKLSDIQKRLDTELGIRMTYMEVRLVVDDLKLTPKDTERHKPAEVGGKQLDASLTPPRSEASAERPGEPPLQADAPRESPGGVSVVVDELARPGAVVSGKVTFTDGAAAEWYLDQLGRLGLVPQQQGYKPSPSDLQAFQMELQNELQKLGL